MPATSTKTSSFLPPTAIVADGATGGLSDAVARRLVSQWLEAIKTEDDAILANYHTSGRSFAPDDIGGTPKSQAKFAKRLSECFGVNLVEYGLTTGKKCRFTFTYVFLSVSNFSHCRVTPEGRDEQTRSHNPWLAFRVMSVSREGVKSEVKKRELPVFVMSHHSLQRLMQRGGLHTVQELRAAMKTIWHRLSLLFTAVLQDAPDPADIWYLPVRASTSSDPLVLTVRRTPFEVPKSGEIRIIFGVTTALLQEYAPRRLSAAIHELDHWLTAQADPRSNIETLKRLIAGCHEFQEQELP